MKKALLRRLREWRFELDDSTFTTNSLLFAAESAALNSCPDPPCPPPPPPNILISRILFFFSITFTLLTTATFACVCLYKHDQSTTPLGSDSDVDRRRPQGLQGGWLTGFDSTFFFHVIMGCLSSRQYSTEI